MAGALVNMGRVLIAQRPVGKWQAGKWEFPGGKIEVDEDEPAALARELNEELGVKVIKAQYLGRFAHHYADRSVEISLWLVQQFEGVPSGRDGQGLKWVAAGELEHCDLLAADLPMLVPLRAALQTGKLGA